MGETVDGQIIEGEENITKAHKEYSKIFYKEEPHVCPEIFDKKEIQINKINGNPSTFNDCWINMLNASVNVIPAFA